MNVVSNVVEGEVFAPGQVQVTVLDHPMARRRIERTATGRTVGDIVRQFAGGRASSVTADGRRIGLDERDRVMAMSNVQIVCVPGKGVGSFFRQIGALLITVAAAFLAPVLAGPLIGALKLGATAGAILTGAITTGLTLAGTLALNALFPAARPQLEGPQTTYSIGGGRNRANPFGPIPMNLGTNRAAPPHAAKPFTEIVGDDQYLTIMVCWGYGPVTLEDIKIGETGIGEFEDIEIETRLGRPTDAPPSLYPNQVIEEQHQIELKPAGRTTTGDGGGLFGHAVAPTDDTDEAEPGAQNIRTTTNDADRIAVDLQAPGGIYRRDRKGRFTAHHVTVRIEARLTSADPDDAWTRIAEARLAGKVTKAVRKTFAADVERDQYDVRVTRISGYHSDETIPQETVYWTALRSITRESPVKAPAPLALTVLRIRATAQLSGSIDALNAVVATRVRSWDAARKRWMPNRTSDNPADLFRHVLQGPANKKPVPTRAIDLDALQEWHDYCAAQGFTFNQYRDFRASVWSTLADICTAGRASPTFVDGKWSVIWDDANAPVVQHFTPLNSTDFKASRGYADKIQALRVRFIDAANAWQQDEHLVFNDGYDETNTERYEGLEFPGVTDRDLIWRHGRYHLAQIALRREVYEITTDYEHLACVRGDRVLLTHDVPRIGLAFGRVKAVAGRRLTLTTPVTIGAQGTFVLRIRHDDGTSSERTIATPGPAETDTVELVANPRASGGPDGATAPKAGDLFAFGYFGRTSTVCRVKAIRPTQSMAARLELVDDAPGIHHADTGPIPAFSPNISEPVDLRGFVPGGLAAVPFEELVEGGLIASVDLSWTPPPAPFCSGSRPNSPAPYRHGRGPTRWRCRIRTASRTFVSTPKTCRTRSGSGCRRMPRNVPKRSFRVSGIPIFV